MRERMTFSLALFVLELLDPHLQDVELLVNLLLMPLVIRADTMLCLLMAARPIIIAISLTMAPFRREEEVPNSTTGVLRPRSLLELREVRPVRVRRDLVVGVRDDGREMAHHRLAKMVRGPRSSRTSGRLSALRLGLEEATPGGSCLQRSLGGLTGEMRFDLPRLEQV